MKSILTAATILLSSIFTYGATRPACDLLKSAIPDTSALSNSADLIVVGKSDRKMILFKDGKALKQYHVSLGFSPNGKKQQMGDGKTPEGRYEIELKNGNSAYHLALKVSYPNKEDIKNARARGVNPGGDIMIHGFPNDVESNILAQLVHRTLSNWTQGCVAVTNEEIEEIFPRVSEGTPIEICP